jgi:hypothetical protein
MTASRDIISERFRASLTFSPAYLPGVIRVATLNLHRRTSTGF